VRRRFQAEDFLSSIFYLLFSIFYLLPFFHWPRPGRGLSISICHLIFAI